MSKPKVQPRKVKPGYEELIGLLRAAEMALGAAVEKNKIGWMQETTLEEVRGKLRQFDASTENI